jgi:hypothetical protein
MDIKQSYQSMSTALNSTGRRIHFNMCEWGKESPWKWGDSMAQVSRAAAPQARAIAPQARAIAPQARAIAPQARAIAPQARAIAPQARAIAPQARVISAPRIVHDLHESLAHIYTQTLLNLVFRVGA